MDEMQVVSRDGIQIKVRDIRFRYRILSETVNGQPVPRTRENPYPFSRQAYIDLSYYLAVNETGQMSWGQAIKGMVLGVIEDYINSHTVDYLTAPRGHERDPRHEINERMFGPGITKACTAPARNCNGWISAILISWPKKSTRSASTWGCGLGGKRRG